MKPIVLTAAAIMLASVPAFAQAPAAPPQPPEMVLMPRAQVEAMLNWMAQPDPTTAIRLASVVTACLANNPQGGVVRRSGPDQCPVVTEALAARDKQIADLTKAHDDAAAKTAPTPAKP